MAFEGGAIGEPQTKNDMVRTLRLLQFGDSALPIGGFSFSSGLETATDIGLVHDLETLEAFLEASLRISTSGDGVGLICAFRALRANGLDGLSEVDAEIHARKLNEETRQMSLRMGRKFAELSSGVLRDDLTQTWFQKIRDGESAGTHPASLAVAGKVMGMGPDDAFALMHYGLATAILGAALRLIRVSFVETQTLLWRSMESVPATYEAIADATLDDMAGYAPVTDILAALHVKGHVRMFMN